MTVALQVFMFAAVVLAGWSIAPVVIDLIRGEPTAGDSPLGSPAVGTSPNVERWMITGAVTAVIVALASPAAAHTPAALDEWRAGWTLRVTTAGGLTPGLVAEYQNMVDRHPAAFGRSTPSVGAKAPGPGKWPAPAPTTVEPWRNLVSAYFDAAHVDAALRVLWCESRGDPTATHPRSGAAGLFQHLPKYWADRSARAGWSGADIYNPEANVAVAAWLSRRGASWSHWTCQP